MKKFGISKRIWLELAPISLIAGFCFAMTSNGGICSRLLGGDGLPYRAVFAAVLAVALWCGTVCLRIFAARISMLHSIRSAVCSLLNTKVAWVVFALAASRLLQAVFYPLHTDRDIYFVSYYLFAIYLAFVVFAYVTEHKKFRKAVFCATVLCFAEWCAGRVISCRNTIYDVFYYCALAANAVIILRIASNSPIKTHMHNIGSRLSRNKIKILIAILAALIGGCVEAVSALCGGSEIMFPRFAFWAAIGFSLAVCIITYREKKCFTERVFLVVALTVGIYMAVFMPMATGVSWDDETHYSYAIDIAQGDNATIADWSMAERDKGIHSGEISKSEKKAYLAELEEKARELGYPLYLGGDLHLQKRIGYLPNASGIIVGQTLNLPFGVSFILGRVGAAIFYALIMYAAMKRLRSGKLILAVVALLPTFMFLSANYTYDAWVLCLSAFAVATMVSWLQDDKKQLKTKEIAFALIIMALAVAPKGVYFPIVLLFLLVPASRFADKKAYRKYAAAVLATSLACFAVFMVMPFLGGDHQGDARFGSDMSTVGQTLYILKHPLWYAKLIVSFLKDYLSLRTSFDYTCNMAYITEYVVDHSAILMVVLFVAAFVDRTESDRGYNTLTAKIGTSVLFYIMAALVATVLYMTCSPVGSDIINGCQPRYLAPLIFPFLILVCNFGSFNPKRKEALQAVLLAVSGYVVWSLVWTNIAAQYVA